MKLKLLEVLRNNDFLKLKELLSQIDSQPNNFDLQYLKNDILIFAVQVGPLSMVKYIVENNLIDDINCQDNDGNTALHLAASSNRTDVIKYLMQLPGINDCLYNKENKQPIHYTTNIETAQLMDYLRTKHIEKIASELRYGFETKNYELLEKLLTNPRDKELLDINGTDPVTHDTILIEFVKKNDYEMVKFILEHGGDPFRRNLAGKLPSECTTDLAMKKLIESSFLEQNIMDTTSHPQEGSPTFRGFLKKWTNFAGGYKLRWFVLDNQAVLSYYKSPNDMNNTCRGLIHLTHAMLRVNSSENTKFEIIIQNPSDGTPVRWHLMANHATEAQKWIWVLQNAIRVAKDMEKQQRKSIMLNHNLSEDVPGTLSHTAGVRHLHPPVTIPESDVLSDSEIAKETADRKSVSLIVADAQEAANDFKELIRQTDSETELPLKTRTSVDEILERNKDEFDSSEDPQNTNSNTSNNSMRNNAGPIPDRSSQYSGLKPPVTSDAYHGRSSSVTSFGSHKSVGSDVSTKSSLAKKLYKKPFKQLSKIGKKTRQSFIVPVPNSSALTVSDSQASFASNASSVASSPDFKSRNSMEDPTVLDLAAEDDENESAVGSNNTDLNVVRNQMSIQLKTFKDFLLSARRDQSISRDDFVDTSVSILNTLEMLIDQEGECVNFKYTELIKKLEKQQKISNIWENSIKQLELEIHQREQKIVELEDKLKAVKKSLRNSVNQLHTSLQLKPDILSQLPVEQPQATNANSAAALARKALTANTAKPEVKSNASTTCIDPLDSSQKEEDSNLGVVNHIIKSKSPPSFAPPPVPFTDPTLTEFLEESDDSDDEFFDAEESDEVKDMSVLERRETFKALKKRQSITEELEPIDYEAYNKAGGLSGQSLQQHIVNDKLHAGSVQATNQAVDKSNIQKFEPQTLEVPTYAEMQNTVSGMTEEMPEAKFKATVDKHGHFIVNNHELICQPQNTRYNMLLYDHTFEGYEDPLRLSLAPEDNRPKISLWGVLKSLVGKDMTKMTLPVSFNEPTSLLQRNVEVIEYSDLLDKAATIESSTLRMVYVATFAASEYASTVGRIAKPFNPLLGETFEYARPDKGYRCFAEQVSHHPPISALVAEAPSWSYYGESNVKTKFLGRSFDIKHLGTWYCEIFPDSGVVCKNGAKTDKEVYTWKKVNNSVIGIIVGNPTIDNYGTMEITNHMTGDHMKFDFKPRGWRASSAYEVKGEVYDANNKLLYYVGGHWNSKIFCKPAGDKNAERFLVWEAAPRKEMMFHLTSFAATLNAPQPHLLPKVACTDTRLRPDQRAMENGDYDLAAAEKNRVEEKQRAARKQRELKGEVYEPTFFKKSTHPITKEPYWDYRGTYWCDRKEGKLKNYKDIF